MKVSNLKKQDLKHGWTPLSLHIFTRCVVWRFEKYDHWLFDCVWILYVSSRAICEWQITCFFKRSRSCLNWYSSMVISFRCLVCKWAMEVLRNCDPNAPSTSTWLATYRFFMHSGGRLAGRRPFVPPDILPAPGEAIANQPTDSMH